MSWPAACFVNKVLLEHSRAHLFAFCGCIAARSHSCYKNHHRAGKSLECVLSGLLQKCISHPGVQK